jgi:hypothetical protein
MTRFIRRRNFILNIGHQKSLHSFEFIFEGKIDAMTGMVLNLVVADQMIDLSLDFINAEKEVFLTYRQIIDGLWSSLTARMPQDKSLHSISVSQKKITWGRCLKSYFQQAVFFVASDANTSAISTEHLRQKTWCCENFNDVIFDLDPLFSINKCWKLKTLKTWDLDQKSYEEEMV